MRLHVIELTTPLHLCLERVNQRRLAKNPNALPVRPFHTEAKFKAIKSCSARLEAAGVTVERLDCLTAISTIKKLLGLPLTATTLEHTYAKNSMRVQLPETQLHLTI